MKATPAELAELFEYVARLIREGDSFDGSLEYNAEADGGFEVQGAFRTGNREGQGGMRILN